MAEDYHEDRCLTHNLRSARIKAALIGHGIGGALRFDLRRKRRRGKPPSPAPTMPERRRWYWEIGRTWWLGNGRALCQPRMGADPIGSFFFGSEFPEIADLAIWPRYPHAPNRPFLYRR
jgi:hypothetical protein